MTASCGVRRNSVHAMFIVVSSDMTGDEPGIAVGRYRDRHVRVPQRLDRRHPRFTQVVEGAGQQDGDGAGCAIAAIPSAPSHSRWSADNAP